MAFDQTIQTIETITYKQIEDRYECLICPHRCKLRNGQRGVCQVREAQDGIHLRSYGKLSQIAIEPIEKKPIYHYKPNLRTLSIGGWSCNFSCDYCQNFMVSQVDKSQESETFSPDRITDLAISKNCKAICFTYNEPVIYFEYIMDVAFACKEKGLDFILKTNAFAEQDVWEAICSVVSAMNIDWKGNQERYRKVAKASEKPVLDCIEAAIPKTHVEISIPIYADATIDEHREFADFMAKFPNVPLHLLKIYPAYKALGCQVTSDKIIHNISYLYNKRSNYVYLQNIYNYENLQDTFCKFCGDLVAARKSLTTIVYRESCCNCPIIKS